MITHTLTETHSEDRNLKSSPDYLKLMACDLPRPSETQSEFLINTVNILFSSYIALYCFVPKMFLSYGKQLIMKNCFASSLWEYLLFNSHGASRIGDLSLSPPEESGGCLDVGLQPAPVGSTGPQVNHPDMC